MSVLSFKRKHARKPNLPRLGNWRRIFTHKPIALYMHGANGSDLYNLVTGEKVGNTGHSRAIGAHGVEIDTNNSVGITDNVPIVDEFSAFTFVRYNSTSQDHTMVNWNFQSPILWVDWFTGGLRTTMYSGIAIYGTLGALNPAASSYRGTGYHCWGAAVKSGDSTSALYLNGAVDATGNPGTWTSDTTMDMFANSAGGSGKSSDSNHVWTIVFDRKIPDSEAEFLTKNPEAIYQILEDQTQYAFTAVATTPARKLLSYKRKHTRKPNHSVGIDWSNPSNRALTNAFYFTETSASVFRNAATGVDATVGAGTPTTGLLNGVNTVSFVGSTAASVLEAGTTPARSINGDEFTWLFRLRKGTNTTGTPCLFGNRYGGTASPLQFVKLTSGGFEYYNNGRPNIIYAIPNDIFLDIAITKRANVIYYYANGVQVASGVVTKTMDANPIYIGAGGSGGQEAADVDFVYALTFERGMDLSEIKTIQSNPYKLITPQTQYAFTAADQVIQTIRNMGMLATQQIRRRMHSRGR